MKLGLAVMLAVVLAAPPRAAAQATPAVTPEALVGTWMMDKSVAVVVRADSSWTETRTLKDTKGAERKHIGDYRWRLSGDTIWWAVGAKSPTREQLWGKPFKVVVEPDGKRFAAYERERNGADWAKTPKYTFERSDTTQTGSATTAPKGSSIPRQHGGRRPARIVHGACRGSVQAFPCGSSASYDQEVTCGGVTARPCCSYSASRLRQSGKR